MLHIVYSLPTEDQANASYSVLFTTYVHRTKQMLRTMYSLPYTEPDKCVIQCIHNIYTQDQANATYSVFTT